MDALIRKQIDGLRGANRNDALRKRMDRSMGAIRNETAVNQKYDDRDVCRFFLAGLCPHEVFQFTKIGKYITPCKKIHSLQLRKDYNDAKAKGVHNFDRELEEVIYGLIVECDQTIAGALKGLKFADAKDASAISISKVTQTPVVLELSKQIKEKLKAVDQLGETEDKNLAMEAVLELKYKSIYAQVFHLLKALNISLPQPLFNPPPLAPLPVYAPPEDLGHRGLVDEGKALMELGAKREAVLDSSKYTAADTNSKLQVCDICGSFLIVYYSDRDIVDNLADHFGGNLHLGYMQIREKLAELQKERADREVARTEDDRRLEARVRTQFQQYNGYNYSFDIVETEKRYCTAAVTEVLNC